MRWLNYHHLFYFWKVAKLGSISEASRELRLSQPTVSAQIKSLEESLGEPLFVRGGRTFTLTETGAIAMKYAEEIFELGEELLGILDGAPGKGEASLTIGVVDLMPKYVSYRLLEPLLIGPEAVRVSVIVGRTDALLADLAVSNIDLILSDTPIPPHTNVKAFNHYLGQSGVSFLATEKLAKQLRKGFPDSLTNAPILYPSQGAAMRRDVDKWMKMHGIHPTVVGEFQDSGLMKLVAAKGHGVVPVAKVVASEICKDYGLELVGDAPTILEKYYLISVERRITHPAVRGLCSIAPERIFGS
jgi:LysR family transcriptional activator of nhaA